MPRLKKKYMVPAAVPSSDPVIVLGCPEFPDLQTAIKCSGFSEGQLRGMIKRGEIRAARMPYKADGKFHIFRADLQKLMEKKTEDFKKVA